MDYIKHFDVWNILKKAIDAMVFKSIRIEVGDVFLIRIGVNIGSEIDGKGRFFLRPVVVIKVSNARSFIGIPITSKEKDGEYQVKIMPAALAGIGYVRAFYNSSSLVRAALSPGKRVVTSGEPIAFSAIVFEDDKPLAGATAVIRI